MTRYGRTGGIVTTPSIYLIQAKYWPEIKIKNTPLFPDATKIINNYLNVISLISMTNVNNHDS